MREARVPHEAASDLSDRQISGLLDANAVGAIIGDPSGRTHEANDAFLEMHGYSRPDFVAKTVDWINLTPADWKPCAYSFVARLLETRTPAAYRKEHFHKDGHRIQLSVGATPIRGTDLILVTLVDVSPSSPARAINPRIALAGSQKRFDLTNREHEVLSLLLEGLTNSEIAAAIRICQRTVADHVQVVMAKCRVQRRGQLFKRVFL